MIPAKKIERHIREFTLPGTRETDERILNEALDAFEQGGSNQTARIHPHLHNWVTKTVAAIVVISVLIPLGYGASKLIRTLILKPAEKTELDIDFKLDKDIAGDKLGRSLYSALTVGTAQKPDMVHARSIRFFVENGQLHGTLRTDACSWPKFKWRTRITLLDHAGRRLASAVHVSENGGVKRSGRAAQIRHCIHFALGSCNSDLQREAQSVSIQWEQVPESTETTPNAWIESDVLPVVYGRVTRADGRALANAVLQIREERKEGQKGIAAPDVYTDAQGFYCFDDIHWAYDIGVLVYTDEVSGDGYYHQYKRLNKTLQGTNKVDFVLEELSAGTTVLKGQMLEPDGKVVTAFKFDIRNPVDWKNHSGEYLYQLGFVKLFSNSDGRFEVSGLPAGKYQVTLMPAVEEATLRFDYNNRREYTCELTEGETVDITNAIEANRAWYGRVLFEDGTPAVIAGTKTEILEWSRGFDEGHVTATLDEEGYFRARFSGDTLLRLESEEVWLTINITKSSRYFSKIQKERYPFRFMSMDKDQAGTLTIGRPSLYHGRILYTNGRPAVPPAKPWKWAEVDIRLRHTSAAWNDGGITEDLGSLDDQGAFSILLTDEQHEKIAAGQYALEIMHPSYEEERISSKIGNFPAELLSRDRDAIRGYTLRPERMTGSHRHLTQCLDSYHVLENFGNMLQQWQAKHNGELPINLAQLNSHVSAEVFARITEIIEYQPHGTSEPDTEAHIIAYDKSLLEKIKGTHVLFSNGTIEYLPQRKLDAVDTEQ